MFPLPVSLPGVRACEFPRPLPMALRLALCAALASAPSGAGAGFPYTLEWKRLTGLPAGPVAWVDSILFLAAADGFLLAVERGSGAVRWRLPGPGPIGDLQVSGDRLLFAGTRGTTGSCEIAAGSLVWKRHGPASGGARIAAGDSLAYFNSNDGWLYARRGDGSCAWKLRTGSRRPARPLLQEDRLYLGNADGFLLAVDSGSGRRLQEVEVGAAVGTLVPAGDRLVAAASDGFVRAWKREGLGLLWERRLGARLRVPPGVVPHAIICLADNGYAWGLHPDTGAPVWKRPIGAKATGLVPLSADRQVMVATDSGAVFAVDRRTGELAWEQQVAGGGIRLHGDAGRLYVAAADGYLYAFKRWKEPRQSGSADTVWSELRRRGPKTGYSKRWSEALPGGGLRLREETVNWSHGFVRARSALGVDAGLRPVSFRKEKIEGSQRLVTRGDWLGRGRVRSERRLAGQTVTDTVEIDPGVLFPETALLKLAGQGSLQPGVADTIPVFDYAELAARPLYVAAGEWEPAGEDSLLKVTMRYGPAVRGRNVDETPDLLPGILFHTWLDTEGGEVRTAVPRFESSGARTDRRTALSWEAPAKPKALNLDHAIPDPARLERLVLRLPWSRAAAGSLFVADRRQHFESDSLGTRLIVRRVELAAVGTALPVKGDSLRPFLEPSLYIQSQHPELRALSAEIAGEERDALTVARRLLQWVYDNMTPANTNVRFKSALEVLGDMRGTCSEYTVLYAALCRAAGLPARIASGFAASPDGELVLHVWPEVFLGEWVGVDPSWNAFPVGAAHVKTGSGLLTPADIARMNLPLQLILMSGSPVELEEYETREGRFLAEGERLYQEAEAADRNFEEERAQELYHRVLLQDWHQRSAEAHLNIARHHLQRGRLEEAEWPLRRMLRQGPEGAATAQAWFHLGRVAEAREDWEGAAELYGRLADRYPAADLADDALGSLAALTEKRSGCRRARPHYQRLVEEYSRSGWAAVAEAALEKCRSKERLLEGGD